MDQKKRHRKVIRTGFTKLANELEQSLSSPEVNFQQLRVCWEMLRVKFEALQVANTEIYSSLLEADAGEEDLVAEMEACDGYEKRFTELRFHYEDSQAQAGGEEGSVVEQDLPSARSSCRTGVDGALGRRKFKLPTIEFKRFSGDLKDWLPFWAQFTKIHEDPDIDLSDKISYLIQATVAGSKARQLVESFPAVHDNYEKIITSLKSRFGRNDLQIEVYIREVLKLILTNAVAQNKMDICTLYDKIETQLRALETLGITSDKCAAMLYPLIESCLPESLLMVWQRSSDFCGRRSESSESLDESSLERRLKGLMSFLRNEVENEQRVSLAAEGFGLFSQNRSDSAIETHRKLKQKPTGTQVPTAAGLMTCDVARCIFCDGSHASENCFKAQKLTLDQRRDKLAEKRACFRCLKMGHHARKCRARLKCVLCGKTHVALMCPDLQARKDDSRTKPAEKDADNGKNEQVEQALANHVSAKVLLQTLRVTLYHGSKCEEVRALIDSGSQRSYILKTTAQRLGYTPKRAEKITHALFGGANTSEQHHRCYDVKLGEGNYFCTFEALDQAVICDGISAVPDGPWIDELKIRNIGLSDMADDHPIELLIGADVAGKLYTGRRHVLHCGLVAIETLLGWTLMGKIPCSKTSVSIAMTTFSLLVKDASLSELWKLDVLGITEPTETKTRGELALAAKELFLNTIRVDGDGRYEVRLPWLEGHPPLPSNYAVAKKRLDITVKKLRAEGLFMPYNEVFEEWKREEIIEEVPEFESGNRGHYLPHRPVVKQSSATTKIRPVFDASAREKNKPSLNHCLEKGLNLIEIIPAVLLRFREQRLGVVSDIRKAFLQISVHEADRNSLRFLWVDPSGNEKIFRHRRVVFGINSSMFLLGATIEFHLAECLKRSLLDAPYSPETVKKLSKSFYVDNCVTSVSDEAALKQFMTEASMLMSEARFDLRGWEHTRITEGVSECLPVLGLNWDPGDDSLTVAVGAVEGDDDIQSGSITKRVILSMAQRIFDPIGFTCPATLCPKLLLQQAWQEQLGWDEPVTAEVEQSFRSWAKQLPHLRSIKIPRWICAGQGEALQLSLHTFCDASKNAYSAVVFLRIELADKVSVRLLAAKSRVAPLKKLSIPRLELLAATIGARLYASVRENFGQDLACFFWSDSSTVIAWIRRAEEWATFVRNRVKEICTLTPVGSWRHLPGSLNPADLPSRGCNPRQLLESRWWEGPRWLYMSSGHWPQVDLCCNEDEIANERKKTLVTVMLEYSSDDWHLTYFSKYSKTIRMMGWILRFAYNMRNATQKRQGPLSAEEVGAAETFVFRIIQQEAFPGENNSKINCLNPVRDGAGIIRLRSRISRRDDAEGFRFPVVLPARHPVVQSLIFGLHENSLHVGTQGLLSLLRENYWILGGRRTIRSVLAKCVICRRQSARSLNTEPTPLPLDRVRDAVAFEVTGVDFAGPLYLKTGGKAWVCLFTCAVYRAVHLELTTSLSTASFIQTLRRFVARRGRPKTVYSDNGTNFVGTENAFGKLDWKVIQDHACIERITWRFNPPTAAWWGGFWERLVGVMKGLLRKVLGRASLDYEDLLTLIYECEAVINARPLTYVSSDASDLMPLTPAHFLRDQVEVGMPDCDQVERGALCRKVVYRQRLRENLRRRFRSEYLGQLKMLNAKKSSRNISLGELVLIGNDAAKRMDWQLGRIVELIPGRDGQVRLVRVDTSKGQLLRPIRRIYPLECGSSSQVEEAGEPGQSQCHLEEAAVNPECHDREEREEVGQLDVTADIEEAPAHVNKVTRSGREIRLPRRFR